MIANGELLAMHCRSTFIAAQRKEHRPGNGDGRPKDRAAAIHTHASRNTYGPMAQQRYCTQPRERSIYIYL